MTDQPMSDVARKLKILVVDDEPDTVASTALLLQAWGHIAYTASNGEEALEVVAREKPDIIVLDLVMPGMNGFELVKRIREKTFFKRPLLIAQTGFAFDSYKQEAIEAGIDLGFAKPLNCEILKSVLDRFSQLLGENSSAAADGQIAAHDRAEARS